MRSALGLILLSSFFAACGGGRDVHGTKRFLRVAEQGIEVFEDTDLRQFSFGTLVHKGGGDYEISQAVGSFASPGAFIVPDVSEDEYMLFEAIGDNTTFYLSDSDDIDLSVVALGRAYAPRPEAQTNLRLDLDNVAPWKNTDDIELVVPNIDVVLGLNAVRTGTPSVDATSVDLVYDFNAFGLPLIFQEFGDRLWVTQLEEKSEGTNSWLAVTRARQAALSMTDGQTTVLDSSLEEVPQTSSFRADIKATEIKALSAGVHEEAVYEGARVEVGSLYAAKKHGYHSAAGTLARFFLDGDEPDFVATVTFGDPYPDTWDDLVSVDFVYTVPVAALGATRTATLGLSVGWADTLESATAGPIAPRLTPVSGVTIQGNDARQNLAGVGTQPLIAWSPPSQGEAHAYRLTVWALQARTDGSTAFNRFVEIYTEDTAFQFPSETLVTGPTYALEITAFDEPSRDVDRAPFRHQLPAAHASMLTGMFVP